MNTLESMQRLKNLECHCIAAREATSRYLRDYESNKIDLLPGFRLKDVRDCLENLEDTYLIRLFAEFEVTLREYWENAVRNSKPAVSFLLESLGSKLFVQYDVLQRVHVVREYRNSIVHGGNASPVTLSEARSYLCTFLSNLPRKI